MRVEHWNWVTRVPGDASHTCAHGATNSDVDDDIDDPMATVVRCLFFVARHCKTNRTRPSQTTIRARVYAWHRLDVEPQRAYSECSIFVNLFKHRNARNVRTHNKLLPISVLSYSGVATGRLAHYTQSVPAAMDASVHWKLPNGFSTCVRR